MHVYFSRADLELTIGVSLDMVAVCSPHFYFH